VPVVIGTVIIFALSGMYQRWWRFLGQRDYERLLRGVVIATLALVGLVALIHPVRIQVHKLSTAVSLPLGVAVLFFLLTLLFCGGARFLVRAVRDRPPRGFHPARDALDVLIVGAGSGGQAILREILRNPALGFRAVGILCDELGHGQRLLGIPVLGRVLDLRRAIAIAKGICESGVKFNWTFQASTDFICRMSQEDVQLLADSGVVYMGFGTESTSAAVLKMMNKRHQRVDEMYETARKTSLAGIKVTFNLILGYPGETEEDRLITFRTMSDIGRIFSNVRFSPNIFTPYPGIPIWPQLRELGVPEPHSLVEWMDMPLGANMLPWLKGIRPNSVVQTSSVSSSRPRVFRSLTSAAAGLSVLPQL